MKSLYNPKIAETAAMNTDLYYPLSRGEAFRAAFSDVFSRHIGNLMGGHWFEAEVLLVTGLSES